MYTDRPKLRLDMNTKDYKIFLEQISTEIIFLYFFEMVNSIKSSRTQKIDDINNIKNNLFNKIISEYIQEINLQDPDFYDIKNFILNKKFGIDTINQSPNLLKIGMTKEGIIYSLDENMEYIQNHLLAMKNFIMKAKLDGEDFDKVFNVLYDEYIDILFVSTKFEQLHKDKIKSKTKAMLRSFYNGIFIFQFYLEDYSLKKQLKMA